jgi:hypothetical protein
MWHFGQFGRLDSWNTPCFLRVGSYEGGKVWPLGQLGRPRSWNTPCYLRVSSDEGGTMWHFGQFGRLDSWKGLAPWSARQATLPDASNCIKIVMDGRRLVRF